VTTTSAVPSAASAFDAGLHGRLIAAASDCRQRRCELTLLLVEIDQYTSQLAVLGSKVSDPLQSWIGDSCTALLPLEARALHICDSRWAILISDCDRKMAVRAANDLMASRETTFARYGLSTLPAPTLSIGAATLAAVPKNFSPQDILDSAERCLYAAQSAGGGMVKSIEIY
jgi:GGDEF domain-containing protein